MHTHTHIQKFVRADYAGFFKSQMSEESLILLSNVLFHAFTKLEQYEQLPEKYNSSFKIFCGFSAWVDMIFSDRNKVILTNRGQEKVLL